MQKYIINFMNINQAKLSGGGGSYSNRQNNSEDMSAQPCSGCDDKKKKYKEIIKKLIKNIINYNNKAQNNQK